MSWKPIWNSLMRSSKGLFEVVFFGVGGAAGAGAGPGGLELFCMPLMSQFILTSSNLSHNGSPRPAGLGVSATYQ